MRADWGRACWVCWEEMSCWAARGGYPCGGVLDPGALILVGF